MQLARPAIADDPRRFGRGPVRLSEPARPAGTISSDLKLFITTFAAGFVFVTVLLA
jgi:hypothetical protein